MGPIAEAAVLLTRKVEANDLIWARAILCQNPMCQFIFVQVFPPISHFGFVNDLRQILPVFSKTAAAEILMSTVYSTRPAGALFVIVCVFTLNDLAAFPAPDSVVNDSIHCFLLRSDTGPSHFPHILYHFLVLFSIQLFFRLQASFGLGLLFFLFAFSFLLESYLTFIAYFTLEFNLEYVTDIFTTL